MNLESETSGSTQDLNSKRPPGTDSLVEESVFGKSGKKNIKTLSISSSPSVFKTPASDKPPSSLSTAKSGVSSIARLFEDMKLHTPDEKKNAPSFITERNYAPKTYYFVDAKMVRDYPDSLFEDYMLRPKSHQQVLNTVEERINRKVFEAGLLQECRSKYKTEEQAFDEGLITEVKEKEFEKAHVEFLASVHFPSAEDNQVFSELFEADFVERLPTIKAEYMQEYEKTMYEYMRSQELLFDNARLEEKGVSREHYLPELEMGMEGVEVWLEAIVKDLNADNHNAQKRAEIIMMSLAECVRDEDSKRLAEECLVNCQKAFAESGLMQSVDDESQLEFKKVEHMFASGIRQRYEERFNQGLQERIVRNLKEFYQTKRVDVVIPRDEPIQKHLDFTFQFDQERRKMQQRQGPTPLSTLFFESLSTPLEKPDYFRRVKQNTKLTTEKYWLPCKSLALEDILDFFTRVMHIQRNYSQQINNIICLALRFIVLAISKDTGSAMVNESVSCFLNMIENSQLNDILSMLLFDGTKSGPLASANADVTKYMQFLLDRKASSFQLSSPEEHFIFKDFEASKIGDFALLRFTLCRYLVADCIVECLGRFFREISFNGSLKVWAGTQTKKTPTTKSNSYPPVPGQQKFDNFYYERFLTAHTTTMGDFRAVHNSDETVYQSSREEKGAHLLLETLPNNLADQTSLFQINILSELMNPDSGRSCSKLHTAAKQGALSLGGCTLEDKGEVLQEIHLLQKGHYEKLERAQAVLAKAIEDCSSADVIAHLRQDVHDLKTKTMRVWEKAIQDSVNSKPRITLNSFQNTFGHTATDPETLEAHCETAADNTHYFYFPVKSRVSLFFKYHGFQKAASLKTVIQKAVSKTGEQMEKPVGPIAPVFALKQSSKFFASKPQPQETNSSTRATMNTTSDQTSDKQRAINYHEPAPQDYGRIGVKIFSKFVSNKPLYNQVEPQPSAPIQNPLQFPHCYRSLESNWNRGLQALDASESFHLNQDTDEILKDLNDLESQALNPSYQLLQQHGEKGTVHCEHNFDCESRFTNLFNVSKQFLNTSIDSCRNQASFLLDTQVNVLNWNSEYEEMSLYYNMQCRKARREVGIIYAGLLHARALAKMSYRQQYEKLLSNPWFQQTGAWVHGKLQELVAGTNVRRFQPDVAEPNLYDENEDEEEDQVLEQEEEKENMTTKQRARQTEEATEDVF